MNTHTPKQRITPMQTRVQGFAWTWFQLILHY